MAEVNFKKKMTIAQKHPATRSLSELNSESVRGKLVFQLLTAFIFSLVLDGKIWLSRP